MDYYYYYYYYYYCAEQVLDMIPTFWPSLSETPPP